MHNVTSGYKDGIGIVRWKIPKIFWMNMKNLKIN